MKKKSIESLIQKYMQAKLNNEKKLMKFYGDMIIKLGGKIPSD